MERIIKVEVTDMMGYSGDTKYFKSLKKAKKYFKELFIRFKPELVDGEDSAMFTGNSRRNRKGKRYKAVVMELMKEDVSENGTEYSSEFITITLEQIEIEN